MMKCKKISFSLCFSSLLLWQPLLAQDASLQDTLQKMQDLLQQQQQQLDEQRKELEKTFEGANFPGMRLVQLSPEEAKKVGLVQGISAVLTW